MVFAGDVGMALGKPMSAATRIAVMAAFTISARAAYP